MVASVSALSSAGQAASYYEADDYYAEGGMAPSEWFGEAAEKLGLSGEVNREKFADLLEGRIAGQQLGTMRDGKVEHRPGALDSSVRSTDGAGKVTYHKARFHATGSGPPPPPDPDAPADSRPVEPDEG